jgi:hypothetical protein
MKTLIVNPRLAVIEDAGHFPWRDSPNDTGRHPKPSWCHRLRYVLPRAAAGRYYESYVAGHFAQARV